MKLIAIKISGFRGYDSTVDVPVSDLRVLVGRNDVGKSAVLEALDIFFNGGKGSVKLDKDDINKHGLAEGRNEIEISTVFTQLPDEIVIDATNSTTLASEYLLNSEGNLEVVKRYPNAGKERVFIRARHPTNPECADLLLKKNAELKSILDAQGLECTDRSKNAELRRSIWEGQAELIFDDVEIDVSKIDSKTIWEQLKSYLPLYTLFQSDRKNSDGDTEIQDPMSLAVRQILGDSKIQQDLDAVAKRVKERLDQVAAATPEKLNEMNPEIANSLNPNVPATSELKWADVFKNVSIAGDDDIPINKRGSGVKRLVLLNFFRADAERRKKEAEVANVIYAIEEPETSQHPDHQRALVSALVALSKTDSAQVLLTTHSPELVKQLRFEDLLLVSREGPERIRAIEESELPYPSLNEVSYAAFGDPTPEYHNELYGYLESCDRIGEYKAANPTMPYTKLHSNGTKTELQITLTEYIRHQIHHPENTNNRPYTFDELRASIENMREFIQG